LLQGRASQQLTDRAISRTDGEQRGKIKRSGETGTGYDANPCWDPGSAGFRVSRRRPQRQLTASGVPGDDDSGEIKVGMFDSQTSQVIDTGSHVVQSSRPATTEFSKASVPQIPHCESTREEVPRNCVKLLPPVRHAPKTTMQETYHGSMSFIWYVEVRFLTRG
jgi:hypothetical protein